MGTKDTVFLEEERHLDDVEAKLQKEVTRLQKEVSALSRGKTTSGYDYQGMEDNSSMRQNIDLLTQRINELQGFYDEPYFGRMDCDYEDCFESGMISAYIGKRGISLQGSSEFLVYDWRNEFCRHYYSTQEGAFALTVDHGKLASKTNYDVLLRRSLEIEKGKLLKYTTKFEAGVLEGTVVDSFLLTVLKDKRRKHRLTDIIKTIQQKQNEIIDCDAKKSFIVQGCAGSGKTMILLHRLSVLLYNNLERNLKLSLDRVKIITPNVNFNTHIGGLSEELELGTIKRLSVDEYYISLIRAYAPNIKLNEEITAERNLNLGLLKELYSLTYFNAQINQYHQKWRDALAGIRATGLYGVSQRIGISVPSEFTMHTGTDYSELQSFCQYIGRELRAKTRRKVDIEEDIAKIQNGISELSEKSDRLQINAENSLKSAKQYLERNLRQLEELVAKGTAENEVRKAKIAELSIRKVQLSAEIVERKESIAKLQECTTPEADLVELVKQNATWQQILPASALIHIQKISALQSELQQVPVFRFMKKWRLGNEIAQEQAELEKVKIAMGEKVGQHRSDLQYKQDEYVIVERNISTTEEQYVRYERQLSNLQKAIVSFKIWLENVNLDEQMRFKVLETIINDETPECIINYVEIMRNLNDVKKNIAKAKDELQNKQKALQKIKSFAITEADFTAVAKAEDIIKQLHINNISRDIMLKNMKDTYKKYGEKYTKANYRHKLYLRLLFCYLYFGRPIFPDKFLNIDEAQDISVPEYRLLRMLMGNECIFNLYGDVKQLVYAYKGIDNWRQIEDIAGTVYNIDVNYRNTAEITEFCNKEFGARIKPVGITGEAVYEFKLRTAIEWLQRIKTQNPQWRIAILSHFGSEDVPPMVKSALWNYDIAWHYIDDAKISFASVESAKGLEFEAVVALVDGMSSNEQYIAFTRALNNLAVVRDKFDRAVLPSGEETSDDADALILDD